MATPEELAAVTKFEQAWAARETRVWVTGIERPTAFANSLPELWTVTRDLAQARTARADGRVFDFLELINNNPLENDLWNLEKSRRR